jgi:putative ABC transport system ATP-binding protein
MLLQACSLTKRYGRHKNTVTALCNVSFNVAEGEFVAVMGPSGSGKSTLLNIIGLLDRPTSGTLSIAGASVTTFSQDQLAKFRNRAIGFVFQSCNLLPRTTSLENVEIPLIYSRMPRPERRLKAEAALQTVGLLHRAKHQPSQLSGGEQQRVAIARALINNPALILADEPTGALDTQQGLGILALLQALNANGRTVILVTHDNDVARHARRLIKMKDGSILSDRTSIEAAAV